MASIEELEARLRRLEDIEEIRRLRMTYHQYTNEGVLGRAADLFTEDGYADFEGLEAARGRAQLESLFRRLEGNVDLIKQFVCNHMVEVDGDEGAGFAYLDARYAQDGKSVIAAVRYNDKYRRTAHGWKFSEMVVHIYFAVPIEQGWAGGGQNQLRAPKPAS